MSQYLELHLCGAGNTLLDNFVRGERPHSWEYATDLVQPDFLHLHFAVLVGGLGHTFLTHVQDTGSIQTIWLHQRLSGGNLLLFIGSSLHHVLDLLQGC